MRCIIILLFLLLFFNFKLPVINLFELAKRYEAGEPDMYIKQYVNNAALRLGQNLASIEMLNANNREIEQSEIKINIINSDSLLVDSQSNANNNFREENDSQNYFNDSNNNLSQRQNAAASSSNNNNNKQMGEEICIVSGKDEK